MRHTRVAGDPATELAPTASRRPRRRVRAVHLEPIAYATRASGLAAIPNEEEISA